MEKEKSEFVENFEMTMMVIIGIAFFIVLPGAFTYFFLNMLQLPMWANVILALPLFLMFAGGLFFWSQKFTGYSKH